MKTLQILNNEVNELLNETSFFIVTIKEDNYENTNDANLSESKTFETLYEAYDYFNNEVSNIKIFETESEYKEVELILNDENDVFEVLETETYKAEYKTEDYGKYMLHFLPKNDGISVSKVEIIDTKTPFYTNEDKRFSVKSEMFDTKEDVINAIYLKSLYISEDEAAEIFDLYLQ